MRPRYCGHAADRRRSVGRRMLRQEEARSPACPGLPDELGKRAGVEFLQPAEDSGKAVEVVGREEDAGLLRDESLFGSLVRDVGGQHRPGRRGVPELGQVLAAQWALPGETLAPHLPGPMTLATGHLAG